MPSLIDNQPVHLLAVDHFPRQGEAVGRDDGFLHRLLDFFLRGLVPHPADLLSRARDDVPVDVVKGDFGIRACATGKR